MKYFSGILAITCALFLVPGVSHAAKFHSLASAKVAKGPKVDGMGGDAVWKKAKAITVEAVDGPDLTVKSVHTASEIFFQISWEDEGASLSQRQWVYDGKKWGVKQEVDGEDSWDADSDRIGFQWLINNSIADFGEKGCKKLCHAPEKEDKMYTNEASQRMDIWQWVSSTTNPLGYADDQYLDNSNLSKKDEKDDVLRINVAHKADDGKPANQEYQRNDNGGKPKFSGKGGGKFLIHGNHVAFSGKPAKGATVPGYVLQRPKGSRGDISASGKYSEEDFIWTLELSRKLVTGDKKNDVQFSDSGKAYFFGLAVWDDSDLNNHLRVKKPIKLTFK